MTPQSFRDLIAQAAIVLGVCVGGWMMLIRPQAEELARLDQQIAEHAALSNTGINEQSIQKAANRMGQIKSRLADVVDYNALANDSSRLYGLAMDLADAHGVQVLSLQPGAMKDVSEDKTVVATRLHMSVQGGYEKIAAFLEDFCQLHAFIKPRDIEIVPSHSGDGGVVEANFACDVLNFAIADSLKLVKGAGHGQS
jgi:Tfp pilus assembly protein PilO